MFQEIDLAQVTVAPTTHWTEEFAFWLRDHDRRPNTVSAYLQDLRHFSAFFRQENGEVFTPSLLNATDLKKYFSRQDNDKSVASTSRNRRLASLRVWVEWAVEVGILEYDPTVCIKRQAAETCPRDRTPKEMARLDEVINNGSHLLCASEGHAWLGLRDRVIWSLMKDAGLRIHEVAGLDIHDLDLEANKIHVLGKGGKKAPVIVSARFMEEIKSWINLKSNSTSLL